jgi:hypothetical protein
MRHSDLLDPQTEEQEAENAAYIAKECERIRASWATPDARHRVVNNRPVEGVEVRKAANYLRIQSLAMKALQKRMEQRRAK